MTDRKHRQSTLDFGHGTLDSDRRGPVECLGLTFESDEERREYFLKKLREGLEELHAKLGGVPFTTVEDAVARLKSLEKWPVGDEQRIRELAERMAQAARQSPKSKVQGPESGTGSTLDIGHGTLDLLRLYKDEVGFPHGEIEDILNLSDPPYYTACPNPFIADFIKHYGKPYDPNVPYSKEPFAVDVSVGKTDPIYKAHSYHTKVPHLAIVPSILHYTEPGDVVLDGFCGSGMTGVAAQWCGSAPESYKRDLEALWEKEGRKKPKWGPRRVVLGDLAPAATFIAANYNLPFDVNKFTRAARQILDEVEQEIGWMYETLHIDGKTKGRIEYTVWSEAFTCPDCAGEVVFLEQALDPETKKVKDAFPCPHCGAELTKKRLERLYETKLDKALNTTIRTPKRQPALIVYKIGKTRYEKKADQTDFATLSKVESLPWPSDIPTDALPYMHMTHERARMDIAGITHIHHFFLPRAAHALAALWRKAQAWPGKRIQYMLLFFVEQGFWTTSICNSYRPTGFSQVSQYMKGIYYVPSQHSELSPWYVHEGKLKRLAKAFQGLGTYSGSAVITTATAARLDLPDNSIDYIFTDPPFGENIYYADLNFLVESWHRVLTNATPEAIVDKAKKKGLPEYQHLMQRCFEEYCRVLKPGRWMTVVFHNSRNAVWNAIQEAMLAAGFVVADVRTLDKQQGSYRQMTSTAVKQDLVISAYKPNGGLEERFKLTAGTEEGVWDFVRTHLRQLPVAVVSGPKSKVQSQDDLGHETLDFGQRLEIVAERQNYLLFDRMVAFHVQRGVTVPLSAAEFYAGLAQRFPERDGMYFLPEQVAEYDKKRMKVKEVLQLQLFVTDEASAIQWLKQQLTRKPQTFQELHPQFLKEIGGWQKHEKPLELSELLEQNFLRYDGKGEVPSQIHSYLSSNFKELRNLPKDDERLRAKAKDRWYVPDPNKAGDLDKLRGRALLREFEEYRESSSRRLKVFRLEAVRAGFKKAWQERDYATIIAVARKIPENVLQEDPKLLMWYDQAVTRMG
ncbi:DNA methylase [Dissulfurirhabdus thermomarina]|uniref:DNA methylase n=1 Tax=Dissulfurirhabdus thermomarina TaxID=1765737 RepID=A0A6N9TLS3_DISTH|nr:DNA methyltransferase [Dissulfurirhabdus thermomarina]NDY41988.1 DNA methylase [Dissulfurirhabdus thermomarina]NMX23463.1 DNA methylase [Dissulfurirhabdus thermomarina]